MQKISLRKGRAYIYPVKSISEEITHFSLQGLLPPGHTLALNRALGTLSQLAPNLNLPRMVMEQQFTTSELCVLLPLLESYPHFCPYEMLLASFNSGNVTEANVARCRDRLEEAQLEGVWEQEMRPIRNVLSRARFKLRAFGIEISSILETGYILMPLPERKQREARAV